MGNVQGRHLLVAGAAVAVGAAGVAWLRHTERETEPMLVAVLHDGGAGSEGVYAPLLSAPANKMFVDSGVLSDIDNDMLHRIGASRVHAPPGTGSDSITCHRLPAAVCLQFFVDGRELSQQQQQNQRPVPPREQLQQLWERLDSSPVAAVIQEDCEGGESTCKGARCRLLCSFVACSEREVEHWFAGEMERRRMQQRAKVEAAKTVAATGKTTTSNSSQPDDTLDLEQPFLLVPLRTFEESEQHLDNGALLYGPHRLRFSRALEAVLGCSKLVATACEWAKQAHASPSSSSAAAMPGSSQASASSPVALGRSGSGSAHSQTSLISQLTSQSPPRPSARDSADPAVSVKVSGPSAQTAAAISADIPTVPFGVEGESRSRTSSTSTTTPPRSVTSSCSSSSGSVPSRARFGDCILHERLRDYAVHASLAEDLQHVVFFVFG
eukprot:m.163420 g.163420  ORF g.163420 m.163420 type:complete len:439 (-) comp17110_c11_seq1:401-1717(-)